jgi:tetratricopeptide (TPR) repeat protein
MSARREPGPGRARRPSPRPAAQPAHATAFARRGAPALVAAAVLACFAPALRNDFVLWDDGLNLVENPAYRGLSWEHLRWMFTTFHGGHYQPLTWVTFGLDYTLWGMAPAGYHLTSVLLHVATAVAVYLVIGALLRTRTVAGSPASPPAFPAAAAMGTLFFAIHPLRVESVAWVSERRDVLSGLFYCLAVLFYLRRQAATGTARRRGLLLSLGCFVLSLLAKAWGMTLPVVLLILDAYALGRRGGDRTERWAALREKVPYVVLAGAAAVLAFRAQQVEAMRTLAQHGLVARLTQAAYGLSFYPWKTLLPLGLSPHYLLEQPLDPTRPRYVVSLVALIALVTVLLAFRRRAPWALAAWACYAVVVSPVLGLLQSGNQLVADRYSYLSCLPFAVLVAAALHRVRAGAAPGLAAASRPIGVAAAAGVFALGILTVRQTSVWRDSRTLWDHVLALDPGNYTAYSNRGLVKQSAGDPSGALADYDVALRINPGHEISFNNRGIVRFTQGDLDGAIADYSAAIRFRPAYADAYTNRAIAREARGDVDGALADYSEALRSNPDLAKAAYGRANIRAAKRDLAGALADYTDAIRADPRYVEAWANRGLVRRWQGDRAGADADLRRALEVAPPDWPGRATLERNLAAPEG